MNGRGRTPGRSRRWVSAATAHGRGSTCRIAAAPGRLSLAAALAAALLLSPGVRDACAGCCRDGAPAVAAPLAAGVAPVHSCCAAPVVVAPACCSASAAEIPSDAIPEDACSSAGTLERSDCRCHLDSRDGLPAEPARRGLDTRHPEPVAQPFPAPFVLPLTADVGGPLLACVAEPPPSRPARILYGVWRN